MTAPQPGQVTPAEIGELLTTASVLPSGSSLAEQAAFFEWRADLLSRIAAAFDTPEARATAAGAQEQADGSTAKAHPGTEALP
jgi:hypothetical protein